MYTNVPLGHPDFGEAVPCRCLKKDWQQKRLSHLQRYSNLGPLTRLTFENLIPQGKTQDADNKKLFQRASESAKAFAKQPDGWLVFSGPAGSGKTHLAAAIVNSRLAQGYTAYFITVPDLLDHLRSTFSPSSDVSYDELLEKVRNVSLLVLDDLGVQSSTPWAKEKLDQVLTHRYHGRLPTILTTDVPVGQLEERLSARLNDETLSRVFVTRERLPMAAVEAGISGFELLKTMSFESFDVKRASLTAEQRQNLEHALRLARSFVQSPQGWLVFQGGQGCGKTHLAAAIVNHRQQLGEPVLFVVVPDFLDHLRSTFSPDSKISYDDLFEKVKKAPLLVLDDFGHVSVTPWAQDKLYQVINFRYNSKLPTVITTSSSLEEIDARISSRMADLRLSTVFNIIAPDYRTDLSLKPKNDPLAHRSRRLRQ